MTENAETTTPDTTAETVENQQNEKLQQLQNDVNKLTDNNEGNNPEKLSVSLTTELVNAIDEQAAKDMLKSIKNKFPDNIPSQLTDLVTVLKSKANKQDINQESHLDTPNSETAEEKDISQLNKYNFDNETSLDSIKTKLDETIAKNITNCEGIDELAVAKNALTNIQNILTHLTKENIQSLQKFILKNLPEGEEKSDFLKSNFKKGNDATPDGIFGKGTLEGLQSFLESCTTYIDNVKSSKEIQDAADKEAAQNEQTAQSQESGQSTESQPETTVDSAPLTMDDKNYPVAEDSADLCNSTGLDAKFYNHESKQDENEATDTDSDEDVTDGQNENTDNFESLPQDKQLKQITTKIEQLRSSIGDNRVLLKMFNTSLFFLNNCAENPTETNIKVAQNAVMSSDIDRTLNKQQFVKDNFTKNGEKIAGELALSHYRMNIGYGVENGGYIILDNGEKLVPNGQLTQSTINGINLCLSNIENTVNRITKPKSKSKSKEEAETSTNAIDKSNIREAGNKKYYAKINGHDNCTYEVEVNSQNQLYPIATEINNIIEGIETPVLIGNNESCINYLSSHLGSVLGDPTIKWNSKVNDYTITSFGKTLTIEPMTIAGDWVSNDLSTCLKLLNFTNYVRSENGPDFKYKYLEENGKKKLIIRGSRGKYKIPLDNFGLGNIDDQALHKFIKYNNHEEREDDRDKRKPNKNYKII